LNYIIIIIIIIIVITKLLKEDNTECKLIKISRTFILLIIICVYLWLAENSLIVSLFLCFSYIMNCLKMLNTGTLVLETKGNGAFLSNNPLVGPIL
jgi:hypothetical protein